MSVHSKEFWPEPKPSLEGLQADVIKLDEVKASKTDVEDIWNEMATAYNMGVNEA